MKKRRLHTNTPIRRGFIYKNKDKKNILMRIDELHSLAMEIDKRLKTKRIMRSLDKFVGGRPYGVKEFQEEMHTLKLSKKQIKKGNDHVGVQKSQFHKDGKSVQDGEENVLVDDLKMLIITKSNSVQ
ncbi:hypothetical protein Tco_0210897 [Tanacetum coccineum]